VARRHTRRSLGVSESAPLRAARRGRAPVASSSSRPARRAQRPAAIGELERLAQRFARLAPAARPPQGGAVLRQRPSALVARGRGVHDGRDIQHAIDHALVIEDAGQDPDRWLVIAADRAANLLEVVVLVTVENTQLAIHAMPLSARYRMLLEP